MGVDSDVVVMVLGVVVWIGEVEICVWTCVILGRDVVEDGFVV